MNVFKQILALLGKKEITVTATLPTFSTPVVPDDPPRLRPDRNLNDYFTLYELTKTNNIKLQQMNRTLTSDQIVKLTQVANLLSKCRTFIGKVYNKAAYPIEVHSGYRCPELNGATAGSSKTSQHMLAEAADWSPVGYETLDQLTDCFNEIRAAAKRKEVSFGQLILEYAKRDFSVNYWLHISLGFPYRDKEKCGQVLHMKNGIYTLIETIK